MVLVVRSHSDSNSFFAFHFCQYYNILICSEGKSISCLESRKQTADESLLRGSEEHGPGAGSAICSRIRQRPLSVISERSVLICTGKIKVVPRARRPFTGRFLYSGGMQDGKQRTFLLNDRNYIYIGEAAYRQCLRDRAFRCHRQI